MKKGVEVYRPGPSFALSGDFLSDLGGESPTREVPKELPLRPQTELSHSLLEDQPVESELGHIETLKL